MLFRSDRRLLRERRTPALSLSLLLCSGCAGQAPSLDAGRPSHDAGWLPGFVDAGARSADAALADDGPPHDLHDLRAARRDQIDAHPPDAPHAKVCKPYCDTIADCGPLAIACEDRVCKACLTDLDCPGGARRCHRPSGLCIMCEQDVDCQLPLPIWSGKCDPVYKLCVRCDSVYDCAWPGSTTPLCINNRCVACTGDPDCAHAPRTGCDANGFCSRCRADAECCAPGQPGCALRCDLATGTCTCRDAQQCADNFGTGKWTCAGL
jgi:hypothetical protein